MKKTALFLTTILAAFSITTSAHSASYYEAGKSYYIYRKYDKAKDMFKKAVKVWPKNGNAYFFLGEIEKIQKNYDKAAKYYTESVKKHTKRKYLKMAFWNLIVLAEQKNDTAEMVKTCKWMWIRLRDYSAKNKMEKLINKFLWTSNKEAIKEYKLGVKFKYKDKEKALNHFKQAMSIDYDFLAPRVEIGMNAYKNKDYTTALEHLDTVASRIKFYAEVQLIVGDIYYNRDNFSSAVSYFDKAFEYGLLSRKTEYYTRLKRATCNYKTSNYKEAIEDLKKVRKYNPRNFKSIVLMAAINLKQDNDREALRYLILAHRYRPKSNSLLLKIGNLYYKKKDHRYLTYYQKLYTRTKDTNPVPNKYLVAYKVLAEEYFKKRYFSRTVNIFNAIPEESRTYNINLIGAKSLYRTKQFDKAIDQLEKLSLEDDDKYMLAKAYAITKRNNKAKEQLKYLISNDKYLKWAKRDWWLKKILVLIEKEKKEQDNSSSP